MAIIETQRLILRQWCEQDKAPFAKLTADPRVMEYFPKTLSTIESNASIERFSSQITRTGWGFWAAERKPYNGIGAEFVGFIGINDNPDGLPFSPCVDIGWRLAFDHWGQGLATEGARAAMEYAFTRAGLEEVVSMTPVVNLNSEKIMRKLGMHRDPHNFAHPKVPSDHVLNEHVLYRMRAAQWRAMRDALA